MGRKKGEKVSVDTPNGKSTELTILKIG
ncbi:MAG: hypothetical protein FWH50_02070 [Coriobacteriia bacterium]|nr:hypothetical protein [Coriobacteriia bacterium]